MHPAYFYETYAYEEVIIGKTALRYVCWNDPLKKKRDFNKTQTFAQMK